MTNRYRKIIGGMLIGVFILFAERGVEAQSGRITGKQPAPPPIHLTDVITDRRLGPIDEVTFSSSQPSLSFSTVRRRRERDRERQAREEAQLQLMEAMERELRTAHDVQMSLLPRTPPDVPGFDLAGRCLPASHVGGDHYTYQWLDDARTRLAIVVAYVSGHEMQAAMTAMRFSAEKILESILSDVHAFLSDTPQEDDVTLVVVKVGR